MSKPLLLRTLAANADAAPTDVHTIKTVLKMLGHYQAPDWGVDEFPDRALFDALRAFQKDQGLKVDGAMKPGGESESALKAAAQMVRAQGRNGDTVLAHISPAEAALLDQVTDGGSINPATGLPEYFIGDMLGELGSGFSSLGDGLMNTLPNLSEDFKTAGRRSTRHKAGDLLTDALGHTVTDALGSIAEKSPSNALGVRLSPSLGIGLETRSDKPAKPGRVRNEVVISEYENTDRANQQRSAPVSAGRVSPVKPMFKPMFKPNTTSEMPIFQNPDRLRQWVKDAQAQTRLQSQQRTVSPGMQPVPAEARASNARTAEALSKTTEKENSMAQRKFPISEARTSAARKQVILGNRDNADFSLKPNSSADDREPLFEWHAASQVNEHKDLIERISKEQGVDPDLVRAIMYMETTHGWYDGAFDKLGINKTILPMNVHVEYWKELGIDREKLHDPEQNIIAGVKILKRLQDQMPNASIQEIATLYQNLAAETVSDYGARVGKISEQRSWEKQ